MYLTQKETSPPNNRHRTHYFPDNSKSLQTGPLRISRQTLFLAEYLVLHQGPWGVSLREHWINGSEATAAKSCASPKRKNAVFSGRELSTGCDLVQIE